MKRSGAFTLIEVLITLLILGILGVAFVRILGTTLHATGRINAENELLGEAQIAEQIIASKAMAAWYLYPPGTDLEFNGGATTYNALAGSSTWTVGSDPILAMILPPREPGGGCTSGGPTEGCYRLLAYYAFPRSHYQASVGSTQQLQSDPRNDDTWVLMEFRANLYGFVPDTTCSNVPVPDGGFSGLSGRLLVEYVQPETEAPSYTIFNVQPDGRVVLHLRMRKAIAGTTLKVPRASQPPLSLEVNARNFLLGCP
ncbi:prepilin-type N-terminal cleavage/methylation domain-containing protein [Oceanithermus sp.]